ncbi:RNA-guided endonuclease InsQ/TnpB family protein [Agathobaculum desmolans]|uniref:RNA-guided endonuclease InsQ/TnpB family protein n=1 Tax=Agathobaculum desmolans TaxID=39484 RepID=UPI00248F3101|nr:RNA-guided endonuclease TnpB family protein [Agathobaculum desmolans]
MRSSAEMPYHIGFKVKIYPSSEQKRLIAVNDGVNRSVYNHLVACNIEKYRLSKLASLVPVYRDRLNLLSSVTGAVRNIKNALPYLYGKDVDEQAIANAIKNYSTAWKNQRERRTGIPTFKRKSYEQSYQTNAHYRSTPDGLKCNVRFEDMHHVTLPKLGRIRIGASPKMLKALRERTCDTRIGSICISRDSVGEYWASFSIASEEPFYKALPKTNKKHGIDLNLLALVNTSDGHSLENRRYRRQTQTELRKSQRKLSRMLEQAKKDKRSLRRSVNYQKQRRKTAYIHRKVERRRTDYLHVLTKREIENQDFIAAEDLKASNMMKNHRLANAIADASWRKFLTMLQYKAALYDKTVVLVPPKNTTQTCSNCGYIMKGDERLTLKDRSWICPQCKTLHERDINAAVNILNRGLQIAHVV